MFFKVSFNHVCLEQTQDLQEHKNLYGIDVQQSVELVHMFERNWYTWKGCIYIYVRLVMHHKLKFTVLKWSHHVVHILCILCFNLCDKTTRHLTQPDVLVSRHIMFVNCCQARHHRVCKVQGGWSLKMANRVSSCRHIVPSITPTSTLKDLIFPWAVTNYWTLQRGC